MLPLPPFVFVLFTDELCTDEVIAAAVVVVVVVVVACKGNGERV